MTFQYFCLCCSEINYSTEEGEENLLSAIFVKRSVFYAAAVGWHSLRSFITSWWNSVLEVDDWTKKCTLQPAILSFKICGNFFVELYSLWFSWTKFNPNEIDTIHPLVAEGNKIACCDCRSEYLFQHGRRTLFPANSVIGIQDNSLGLLSQLVKYVNHIWRVKVLQDCFSANLASVVLNYCELRVCFHSFIDWNFNAENRA